MRLKKLIVQGFKSFADRTEFVFDCPITGIVGPNGCGKSNVVDAFKWVLGEQSAKSLRGDAMMDVIFNGSAARKPSGMAEVVLVFENPQREDSSRMLAMDVDEVAVGRRLFRDGTSEYHLNNASSRLKDIRELFLDTGVGADAYSVIEQGKVSAMLEANPAERRIIFEEAAGISKYKVKKKEAQRKLEKVDQNLLRVNDIVEEVDKRLRSVKIQAGKARNYQELSGRLNELRLGYALQEYHTHHQQRGELDKELEETQFQLDDLTGDLASRQNELVEKREQFDSLSQQKQRLEYDLVQARAAVQSAQQKQHYAQQQLSQMAEQLESFERDKTALNEKLSQVTQSLDAESTRLQSLTQELAQARQQIDQRQAAFRDGQLQLNQINKDVEQNKSAVLDLMRKLANVNSRLGAIEIERKNIASQQQRLSDRRRIVVDELQGLEAKKVELEQKLNAALELIAQEQAKLEAKKQESAALGKQITAVGEQLGAAKEHRSGLLSREKLLKDLEAKREGVSEGVKSVLRQRESKFNFIRGLVADVLRVDVEHAHVIEAALDGRDQWLITNDQSLAIAADEVLNDLEGRVNVLCVDRIQRETGENNDATRQRDTGFQPVRDVSGRVESQASQSEGNAHGLEARVTNEILGATQHRDTGFQPVRDVSGRVESQTSQSEGNTHGLEARVTNEILGATQQRDTGFQPVRDVSGLVESQASQSEVNAHGLEARVTNEILGATQYRDTGFQPVRDASELSESQTSQSEGNAHGLEARVTNEMLGATQHRDTGFQPVRDVSGRGESQTSQSEGNAHGLETRVTNEILGATQRGDTGLQPVRDASELTESEFSQAGVTVGTYDWNQHPHRIRLAADLIKVDPNELPIVQHLLGKTIVVDDLTVAADLHRTGPAGYRFVTLNGDVLEADGTLRAGPLTAAMGLLSRRSELDAVSQQLAEVDERVTKLTAQLSEGNATARELEEQQNALRNAFYQANTTKVELTSSIAQNNDKQNALKREQPLLDRELAGFMDHIGRLKLEEEKLAAQKSTLETEQTDRQKSVEELTARHAQLAEELKEIGETLTTARVALGQVQEKQLASQQEVQRETAAKAELIAQIERITRSAESVANRSGGLQHELESARQTENALEEKQKALTTQIESLIGGVQEAADAVKTLSEQVEKLRADHSQVEQELHQLQLQIGELKVRLETLINRTMEELQLDLPGKYASLSAVSEEGVAGPGYQPSDVDWEAVVAEIKELRDRIHRLGNVNVEAIAEQDELEERQKFLVTQIADLTGAKKQLEELIETINIESSARFEQTFNTVREHFQGMFRKLFGGGKADVYLETELDEKPAEPIIGLDGQTIIPEKKKIDILDAGIEIIARPPGKQPATISQLSGGEKTMTCIALLMSIFKSKPSPFCILDEVDAALDEANNQRFNLIVQEFLDRSQFIVITHSKRTMQIADVLYGVTMQEQGVSKRVAVKFEQVDNHGRISESAAA